MAHSLHSPTIFKMKQLSSIANHVLHTCSQMLEMSSGEMVRDFEAEWKPENGDYPKKLVEYCCSMALPFMCENIGCFVGDGSFSRCTYDMMLAWEKPLPTSHDDDQPYTESLAKEQEDDVSLFYSDIMPLLVNHEPSIGEDAFVWMGSLAPLVSDVTNARFMFQTLTATTSYRLHFPAYDMLLKQLHRCIKNLQNQANPRGVELADDEYILHVDGTSPTHRVIRHIGGTSWPGKLTLTNYALYFEAAGAMTYEDAFKVELAKDAAQTVKPAATGPWGVPLYDKAVVYESSELSEEMTLEFPEVSSSTRRDLWLALIKEITLMHQFLAKYKLDDQNGQEMQSRTMLGVMRLHAARAMLRISLPPEPKRFLIFALFEEVPKGDIVVERLAESLKKPKTGHPCTATSLLRKINVSQPIISANKRVQMSPIIDNNNDVSAPLQSVVNQAREEEREVQVAKANVQGLEDEGITNSLIVLVGLLRPIDRVLPRLKEILTWKKPIITLAVLVTTLVIVYKEWVGKGIGACLVWLVVKMVQARRERLHEKCNEIVVDASSGSDQSTMQSIVSAEYGWITAQTVVKLSNIAIMKIWSIAISKAKKHTNLVMAAMCGLAVALVLVPFKYFLMSGVLYCFIMASKEEKKSNSSDQGNRRLKEWWDSIPIVPVRIQDKDITVGRNTTE